MASRKVARVEAVPVAGGTPALPGLVARLARAGRGGFTLIEVIISITIVAIISGLLVSGFQLVSKSWRRGQVKMDANERARFVESVFRRQVASTSPVVSRYEPLVAVDQPSASPAAPPPPPMPFSQSDAKVPFFKGGAERLMFVGLYSIRANALPGLTLIEYDVEPSEGGQGYSIVEYEGLYVFENPLSLWDQPLRDSEFRTVLLDNLQEASIMYYGLDLRKKGVVPDEQLVQEWVPEWDSKTMGGLPDAVKIVYRGGLQRFRPSGDMEYVIPIRCKSKTVSPAEEALEKRRLLLLSE